MQVFRSSSIPLAQLRTVYDSHEVIVLQLTLIHLFFLRFLSSIFTSYIERLKVYGKICNKAKFLSLKICRAFISSFSRLLTYAKRRLYSNQVCIMKKWAIKVTHKLKMILEQTIFGEVGALNCVKNLNNVQNLRQRIEGNVVQIE